MEMFDVARKDLTVAFVVEMYMSTLGEIFQGLDVLNKLFGELCYDTLPLDSNWLDHLDILDAVWVTTFGTLKKFDQYYSERMSGYCAVGRALAHANAKRIDESIPDLE